MLGRDDRALDDEDVQAGVHDGLGHPLGSLGGDRRGGDDAGVLHLLDARGDQLELDGLEVHLLHARGGLVVVELADLLEERRGVLVAGPQPLEVEHAEAAEASELDRRGRRHRAVHRRAEHRQLELVGVDLPGDVDVLGVARAPRGHDGDVVETVGLPGRFVDADLHFRHGDLRSKPPPRRIVCSNLLERPRPRARPGQSTPSATQSNSVRTRAVAPQMRSPGTLKK